MKRAIIIGATSGIGLATARLLHQDGWTVGLMGRRAENLARIAQEMQERVFTRVVDICQPDADTRLLELITEMGGVELICHVSGIGWQNLALDNSIELATAETNVLGFVRMVTAAYNHFASDSSRHLRSAKGEGRGGHIVVVSSIAGTKGLGAAPAYSATKRFQNTYIQCLAQQARMRQLDIRFTDIRPGFVDTALLSHGTYPMLMNPEKVARRIVKAIYRKERKVVIDWRYALLTFFWRLIPDMLWERMKIKS